MTTALSLRELTKIGVSVATDGTRLRLEAASGVITPELRNQLAVSKAEIIAQLNAELRHKLEVIAESQKLGASLIRNLSQLDIASCHGLSDETLIAYTGALSDRAIMEAGLAPTDYTHPALCRHCGPVMLWPSLAEHAVERTEQGWPIILGCPWCHNRCKKLPIPRPS